MQRRECLGAIVGLGGWASLARASRASQSARAEQSAAPELPLVLDDAALKPPETGPIRVAFLISDGANVIDTAGPWEVFQDVHVPGRGSSERDAAPFELFTVADSKEPVRMTGGLRVVPEHAVADAPEPRVVVIPAMQGTPRTREWLQRTAARADVVMSVCTGAFQLASAGLLDDLAATTHHDFQDDLARSFPKVHVERGRRFVESSPRISTAGGLTSGIDLALRVVDRYFGRAVADATARYMEHDSKAWRA